jgi:hypothetical protein
MNVNIMPFIFHHGEFMILPQCFVSSKWTQCIRFLVSFIALPWTTVLVRLQLHSSSTSKRFFVSAYMYDEGVQEFLTVLYIHWFNFRTQTPHCCLVFILWECMLPHVFIWLFYNCGGSLPMEELECGLIWWV